MGRTSDARQRLMDAAYDLIWEYSYGAVTIDAICKRAGVQKGSFYYFFDSKSQLAVAAISMWWVERKKLVDSIFQPEVPPLERIRKYLDIVSERQIEHYNANGQILGCPIFTLGCEITTQNEPLRTCIQGILTTGIEYFRGAIEEAQKIGDLGSGDAGLKTRMLWAFYEGTLTQARIDNNPELLYTLSSDALEMIGARAALVEA